MLIIPAIDLKDGCVVRFVQGRRDMKLYSRDPLKVARHWVKSGAQILHIVDLDGAFTGIQKNLNEVKKIVKNISIPVQVGGGIRRIEAVQSLLDLGVERVVLGTKAVTDQVFLKKAYKRFQERIIVSLDAREGKLLIKGWRGGVKNTDISEFGRFLKAMGFKEAIYTDTIKDGTLSGPNIKGAKELIRTTGLKIIVSGGISSLDDIHKLKKLEKNGVTGIIIGKALYEGKFTLSEAIKLAQRHC